MLVDFLFEIQFRTIFNRTFFDVMFIFCSIEPQSESTFPFFYIIIFQTCVFFDPLAPLWRGIDICAHGLFCIKFNYEQLLLEAFFDAMCIFVSVRP